MQKRIQKSIITVAIITIFLMTFDMETIYLMVYRRRMQEDTWLELILFIITTILIIILCIYAAKRLSKKLVKPVEDMAEHLDDTTYMPQYDELMPIMNRIRVQHAEVLAAAKARQDFSANVSHELKTPLTAITGYADLIENGMASPEEQKHFASEIKKNSDRLLHIIDDIISLAELDRSEDMPFESLDLYEVVQECMETLKIISDKSNVALSFEGQHCNIYGNKENLKEVVFNLVQNAIRYNKENGHVWVKVYVDKSPVLSVKDDGIGIPVEDQEKVFERFYRVDKSHSKATGGTGLGLSIVKHIVELHKGSIILDSKPNQGTEIKVVF